jgi:hypothetical protein
MKKLIAIVIGLFLACSSVSYAAINKVQDATTVVGTNTVTVTLPSVTVGDMLGVCVHSGASAINSIADNQLNVYNQVPPGYTGFAFWWVKQAKAGNTTLTVTSNAASSFLSATFAEFSGMGTGPSNDGNFINGTYGLATTIQSNVLSTSGGNPELLFGCGIVDGPLQTPTGLIDYGGGGGSPLAFTNIGQTTALTSETQVGAWQSVATTGPFGFQWSVTSANTIGALAAFKPASPALNSQSICPQNGPCFYVADTMANYINLYKCNSGITCQGVIKDAAAACVYNTKLTATGGGGNFRCDVVYDQNQGAWIED